MNNFLYTLVLVVFFSFSGFQQAQNLSDNYKPLTCKGALSTDLSTDYMVLANKEIDIAQSKGMLITADVRDFFVGNNADLNNLFFSGKVLFGDEVTKYVQSVGNRILEKNDIKRDIRFYVLKSSEVNAFANQNNIIFITIGLLTQLENESQLAFVLGHEITHIVKDHSIVGYQHTQDKSRDFANGLSTYDDLVQNLSDYSQENELESDKMGLELINKAGYTSSSSVGVIKVLKYGLLPYDEQVFDRSFFNTSNFTLEESNFAKNIEVVPDKESDFETHPEENERINKLEKMIKADNGEEYMISKDQFLYIRDLARFENLKVNLLKKEFIRSLYESYLLQQTYPNNEFVKDVQAKSIYGIAKVMNSIDEDILEESITKELSVSEYYNLYSLHYYNLEDKEQLALAISYLAHQNDSDYNKYIEDLIVDLKTEHEVVYSDFKWAIDKDKKKEEKEEVDESKLSKVEKLEKLSSESVEKENSMMVAALAASTKNKDVLDLFIDVQDRKIDKESKSNKKSNLTSAAEKKERRKKNRKLSLSVDSLSLIDPFFYSDKKSLEQTLVGSRKRKSEFVAMFKDQMDDMDIYVKSYTKEDISIGNIDDFNDHVVKREYLKEFFDSKDFDMIPLFKEELLASIKDNNQPTKFMLTGAVSYKNNTPNATGLLLGILNPVMGIMAVTVQNSHFYKSNYYYLALYDIEKEDFVFYDELYLAGRPDYFKELNMLRNVLEPFK